MRERYPNSRHERDWKGKDFKPVRSVNATVDTSICDSSMSENKYVSVAGWIWFRTFPISTVSGVVPVLQDFVLRLYGGEKKLLKAQQLVPLGNEVGRGAGIDRQWMYSVCQYVHVCQCNSEFHKHWFQECRDCCKWFPWFWASWSCFTGMKGA